jgi:hypothetical protein
MTLVAVKRPRADFYHCFRNQLATNHDRQLVAGLALSILGTISENMWVTAVSFELWARLIIFAIQIESRSRAIFG